MRAKRSSRNLPARVAVREDPCWCRRSVGKSLSDFGVGADGEEAFFLQGAEEHGLFVGAEFADFVEEENAAVRRSQEAGAGPIAPVKALMRVAKERAHRTVAANGGAIDLDEIPGRPAGGMF